MSIPSADRPHAVEHAPAHAAKVSESGRDREMRPALYKMLLREPPGWFRLLAWIGVLCWAATIYWFSSRTGPEIEELNVFQLTDKVAHFIAFFCGAPAFFLGLTWSFGWTVRRVILVCVLGLALYGAADEYHQTFTANRTGADVWDWTGDALGGLAGTLVCGFVYARFLRKDSHRPAPPGD